MKIRLVRGSYETARGDMLAVALPEKRLPAPLKKLDRRLGNLLSAAIRRKEIAGKPGDMLYLSAPDLPVKHVLFVGIGKPEDLTLDRGRQAAGRAARAAQDRGLARVSTDIADRAVKETSPAEIVQAVAEGFHLSTYRFEKYKSKKNGKPPIGQVTLLFSKTPPRGLAGAAERGRTIARAVLWARDLISHPSSDMTPRDMAGEARSMARRRGKVAVRVFGRDALRRLKMGGILAVGRGSDEPPCLIVAEYRGRKGRPVALVGKTVTFDTGGISIKPSAGMDQMKDDMSGGAAVLATIQAAADLGLPVHLIGVLPAVENMPSGKAYKPGDVLKSMSGRTIEVLNTDAEGRLILADALHYAATLKPELIVDVATLTGACSVAVGNRAIAMMGTSREAMDALKEAGERTGER
ncbi:MAG: leucyl aminopeptidase, partial [Nitrospirae bacterium]|nr:leucyl aminopeptidase [Nitrospirota bacterium]